MRASTYSTWLAGALVVLRCSSGEAPGGSGNTGNGFLLGENEELHKVAAATQQAELSFDLFLQVKNKVVQAYQEIMRMQL